MPDDRTYGSELHDLSHRLDPANPLDYGKTMLCVMQIAASGLAWALGEVQQPHPSGASTEGLDGPQSSGASERS